ncbi:MAG: TatD family hydrolase [Lentisphaeria bacterium]|nr:TatD family hydrolase [Lentisphaeria bacterium]
MTDFFDYHTHNWNKENAFISVKMEVLADKIALPSNSKFFLEYHPWNLPSEYSGVDEEFYSLAESEAVFGIGEIGLDKLKIAKTSLQVQLAYFEELVKLAARLNKPIMLHIVRAWDEARKILDKYKLPQIYFHGFYGKIEFLRELLNYGMIVSLNPKMLERAELYDFLRANGAYEGRVKLESDDSDVDLSCLYAKFYERLRNGGNK